MLNWLKRDYLVLLVAWGLLIWGAIATQATFYGYDPTDRVRNVVTLLSYGFAVASALIVLLPAVVLLLRTPFNRLVEWFQQDTILLLLLAAFSIYPLFRVYYGGSYILPLLGLLEAVIVSLLVLWFFYRRDAVPIRLLLLVLAWSFWMLHILWLRISLVDSRVTPYSPIDLLLTLSLLALTVSPLLLLISDVRQQASKMLDAALKIPASTLIIGVLVLLAVQVGVWQATLLNLNLIPPVVSNTLMLPVLTVLILKAVNTDPHTNIYTVGRVWLWVVVMGYVILAVPLAISWMGSLTPDGYAYMQIARRYAQGQFVVRGLWSPLISWLLAVPIRFGLDAEVSARVLAIINNTICVALTYLLAGRFFKNRLLQAGAAAAMAVLLLRHGFWPITPGIYATTCLVAYYLLITHPRIADKPLLLGTVSGVLGAFAYFARAFNLPYVLLHIILTGLLLLKYNHRWSTVLKLTGSAFAGLIAVSAPWVFLLSQQFGRFLISTAPLYARAKYGPDHPIFQSICYLKRCTNRPDYLFGWEDPDIALLLPFNWSLTDSWDAFWFKWLIIRNNFGWWPQTIFNNLGLWAVVALVVLIVIVIVRWEQVDNYPAAFLLMTQLLYILGYQWGDAAELRYYYPLFPLFVVTAYLLLYELLLRVQSDLPRWGVFALAVLPAISFGLRPVAHTPTGNTLFDYSRDTTCTEADIGPVVEYFEAPMAADTELIHQISYYSQVRSVGQVNGATQQAIHEAIQESDVVTVLIMDEALAETLQTDYDYTYRTSAIFCRGDFTILSVP